MMESKKCDSELRFDGTKVFSDTHPAIERKMIELIRTLTPAQKLAKIGDMGRFMKQAAFVPPYRRRPAEARCRPDVRPRPGRNVAR